MPDKTIRLKAIIPPPVIRNLAKYIETGVVLSTIEEVFEGKRVRRWLADGTIILWTEEA